ncbi:MAG: hypothetical protein JW940_15680 [Polyangiaceae bacterium]|nr:hypothetical protein [Polyangiaceae bacterium]
MRTLHALTMVVCVGGCATYQDDLNRGQQAFEQNHYDEALSTWRALESDTDSLGPGDQARYAYLRGMTDYRLGFRADARHWLALADAVAEKNPTVLNEDWRKRLNEALADLNAEVWKVTPAEATETSESRSHGIWPSAGEGAPQAQADNNSP